MPPACWWNLAHSILVGVPAAARARSQVTFPLEEADVVAPCPWDDCEYTEKLLVGWRALHGQR
eukprot:3753740-Prymnesium_polylepis.1